MIGLWKVGFCSFTCRPYQFASDEGICCKLATIAPCWGRGHLAGHPTHEMSLRRILLAACQSSSPCFRCFDQSVMMFVNRKVRPRGIGSQNVQKIAAEESWWRWREMRCWNWFAATVSTPVTFVTFTRLLRISRALLHKFNPVFPHISRSNAGRLWLCLPRLNQAAFHLFAQNIHWLNRIWEF